MEVCAWGLAGGIPSRAHVVFAAIVFLRTLRGEWWAFSSLTRMTKPSIFPTLGIQLWGRGTKLLPLADLPGLRPPLQAARSSALSTTSALLGAHRQYVQARDWGRIAGQQGALSSSSYHPQISRIDHDFYRSRVGGPAQLG